MRLNLPNDTSKVVKNSYIITGCIGLVSTIFFHVFYLKREIFVEGIPIFDVNSKLFSFTLFISTALMFWGLANINKSRFSLLQNLDINIGNSLFFATILSAVILLILFVLSPITFSELAKEDRFVEWASAIFLFVGCIITFGCLVVCQYSLYVPKITKLTLVFFIIIFFVIAMEEVSWFQRVIDVKTPELFKANLQGELNLHNFATNKVENAYYIGSFLFLVVLPFLRFVFPFITQNNYLNLFVPQAYVIVPGAIASAYNYDMWNNPFIQTTFFGSVIVLFLFFLFCENRSEKIICAFTLFLIVLSQVIFLINSNSFDRISTVTEYKELFIPLGFSLYALSVFNKTKQVYSMK